MEPASLKRRGRSFEAPVIGFDYLHGSVFRFECVGTVRDDFAVSEGRGGFRSGERQRIKTNSGKIGASEVGSEKARVRSDLLVWSVGFDDPKEKTAGKIGAAHVCTCKIGRFGFVPV